MRQKYAIGSKVIVNDRVRECNSASTFMYAFIGETHIIKNYVYAARVKKYF